MRLLRPFVQLMRGDPRFAAELLAHLDAIDADERIPISAAHALLREAIALTGDEALGLRAGAELSLKDIGVLGYAMASATDLAAALHVGARHMRLVSDAVEVSVVRRHAQAEVRFSCRMNLPRAVADYTVCATLRSWAQVSTRLTSPETRVCFLHAAPADLEPYARAFPGQQVLFSAPYLGFVVPEAWLSEPFLQADEGLHAVLRRSAELLVAQLPPVESLSERVRMLLIAELASGRFGIARTAKQLRLGPRTLARRLEAEGTSFSELLETLRHGLAKRYLCEHDMAIQDIALLTGFAQTTGFYRAFRRWTGMTPNEYRLNHAAPDAAGT
jgi:AraC-like DNA-binding protein